MVALSPDLLCCWHRHCRRQVIQETETANRPWPLVSQRFRAAVCRLAGSRQTPVGKRDLLDQKPAVMSKLHYLADHGSGRLCQPLCFENQECGVFCCGACARVRGLHSIGPAAVMRTQQGPSSNGPSFQTPALSLSCCGNEFCVVECNQGPTSRLSVVPVCKDLRLPFRS